MDAFQFQNGVAHAEQVALTQVAEEVGTPVYVYSAGMIRDRYTSLTGALSNAMPEKQIGVHYAVKANGNQAVLSLLAKLGSGADVVSGGELKRCLAAGIKPASIVFAGVGKTREELGAALDAGILAFNVESEPELEALSEVAASKGMSARVGLRVNPDVDAKTHAKITTGKAENKFGVPIERAEIFFKRAHELPGVEATSLSVHIGSQLMDLEPFRLAYAKVGEKAVQLREAGYGIDAIDLGGGLGIGYGGEEGPSVDAYAAIVKETVGDLGFKLAVEPGRWMVGSAGVLLAKIVFVKHGETKRHVIVDAAMNDLIRPTLYEAHHRIEPVIERDGMGALKADIVGPICESGDYLAKDRDLPEVEAGDLMMVRDAGAYSAVMASTYNARPLVPEVLVDGDRYAVIRERQSIEALIALDLVPDWI